MLLRARMRDVVGKRDEVKRRFVAGQEEASDGTVE